MMDSDNTYINGWFTNSYKRLLKFYFYTTVVLVDYERR